MVLGNSSAALLTPLNTEPLDATGAAASYSQYNYISFWYVSYTTNPDFYCTLLIIICVRFFHTKQKKIILVNWIAK